MKTPVLTMGMVVYNEEKYIREAIESLLAQTFLDFTLLISDNASTDKTQEICQEYAKKDSRIVYVRQEKNIGTLANWRYVISRTKTPYFMLCGGHDTWHPQLAEKLLQEFENEKIVLCYSESGFLQTDGTVSDIAKDDYTTVDKENPVERYLYFLKNYNVEHIFFGIWRTEALQRCDLNLVSPTADIIILEQAALEGRFKQRKEVLSWRRVVRREEGYIEMTRRQVAAVRGVPKSSISLFAIHASHLIYVAESLRVIFRKQYKLGLLARLWLSANVLYVKFFYRYTMLISRTILKYLLPQKTFTALKDFWHKANAPKEHV